VGCGAVGVEVPFDSVLRCRTPLRTGSSRSFGMTDWPRVRSSLGGGELGGMGRDGQEA